MDPSVVQHIPRPPLRHPRPGDLLVAAPSLFDPNFRRTVIYLLQHDDEGSAGVVVNRRYEGSLAGLDLPEWVMEGAIVHEGGPVAADSMLALASTDSAPLEARRSVGPQVCVIDMDTLADVAEFHPLQLYVGYAGWSAGQLDVELARQDWFVVGSDPFDVLATDPEEVWARVLRRQRDLTRLWSTLPEVASAN